MEVFDGNAWAAARSLDRCIRSGDHDRQTVASLEGARRRFTGKAFGLDGGEVGASPCQLASRWD